MKFIDIREIQYSVTELNHSSIGISSQQNRSEITAKHDSVIGTVDSIGRTAESVGGTSNLNHSKA